MPADIAAPAVIDLLSTAEAIRPQAAPAVVDCLPTAEAGRPQATPVSFEGNGVG
ncbi:hypothetical protein PI125_g7989 [Phytophthora idaei]|nr:hypothetical protein PI125_g7989 [Phytophthora idaei]